VKEEVGERKIEKKKEAKRFKKKKKVRCRETVERSTQQENRKDRGMV